MSRQASSPQTRLFRTRCSLRVVWNRLSAMHGLRLWITLASACLVVCVVSAPVVAGAASADEGDNAAAPLRYRRVMAPADRMHDWPLGRTKYLPMDVAEFERLLAAAQSPSTATLSGRAVSAVSAQYSARLVGDRLVDGRADIDVTLRSTVPALLALTPCNLAIEKATWAATDSTAAAPLAQLGAGADGKLWARVEHSGRLQLEWSLAGRRDSTDILEFLLALPDCPNNQMTLTLPAGIVPSTDVGAVSATTPPADGKTVAWRLVLGGQQQVHLRLLTAGVQSPRTLLALARESSVYDLSLHGVEVSAQWTLQAHNEPLRQVTILLDPGLQLVTAKCGDVPVVWSTISAAKGQTTRVVVSLPEPIQDAERVLRLGALAPLVLDRPWRLPRIRADGLSWQEGDLTLLIPEPLLAKRLAPAGCMQTGTAPLTAPRVGESATFQCFDDNATVALVLGRRDTIVQANMATDATLGSEENTARITADFRLDEGVCAQLDGVVTRGWTVEAVESIPTVAIADWIFEPQRDASGALTIRMGRALSAAQPIRLVILTRQVNSPPAQTFRVNRLLPVTFRGVSVASHLVSLHTDGPYDLRPAETRQLQRVDPARLSLAELDLFASAPRGLLFEADRQAGEVAVTLAARKPKYAAAVDVDATVGAQTLREEYAFRCAPETDRVERVFVRFYPRRETPPQWALKGEDGPQMTARQLTTEEQTAAGLDSAAEVWEISLQRPRSGPFEITAVRESKRTGEEPVSLAALPEASRQWGTLVVRTQGLRNLKIENRRLEPIPSSLPAAERGAKVQGSFRFEPLQDTASGPEAALCVAERDEPAAPATWIWQSQLESWYECDGGARHRLRLGVQNLGNETLRLWLPAGTASEDVRGVWINDRDAHATTMRLEHCVEIAIELPSAQRFPLVTVEWTAGTAALGIFGTLTPPTVTADFPVLNSVWTAWLPPDYDFSLATPNGQDPSFADRTWRQRLWGGFARPAGARPFDPFSAQDWGRLLTFSRTRHTSPAATAATAPPTNVPMSWPSATQPAADSGGALGWSACHLSLADRPRTLGYVRCDAFRLFAAAALLLSVGLGCWKIVDRPILLLVLLGTAAANALLLPQCLAGIASAVFIGLSFSIGWRWLRRARPAGPPPTAPEPTSTSGAALSATVSRKALLLVFALLSVCGSASGDESTTASPAPSRANAAPPSANAASAATPAETAPYRVIVPIDSEMQPTGGKVYLPEPFYRELQQRAARVTDAPRDWLLLSATYRGAVTRDATSNRLNIASLKAQFDLRIFARATRVQLPLRADDVTLAVDRATLDGQEVYPQWDANAAVLSIDAPDAGVCRLELLLRPTVRGSTGPGLDFAIPRVANSRLELTLPPDAPPLEVPTAGGAVRREAQPSRLCADLGPVDRLTVRWQEPGTASAVVPTLDVRQLMWLRVLPGSVVIDAKFRLHVVAGQVQQFQLIADRRLRLLPMSGKDAPIVEVGPGPRQTKIVTFRWLHPLAEETTVDASFLWTETSGVGNFPLPQLDVVDAHAARESPVANASPLATPSADAWLPPREERTITKVTVDKRWLAVTVDPALDREEQFSQGIEGLATAEFLAEWGNARLKPQSAYRLNAPSNDWKLLTRPHEPRTFVNESLALDFDRDSVAVAFHAQLITTAGYVFEYRLTGPGGLKIERLSLLEDGVEHARRWSQDANGTITVFLTGPVSGRQQLVVFGRLPLSTAENWPVPQMHVARCQLRSSVLRLFRRPAVLLTLQGEKTSDDLPAADKTVPADFGRFVGGFFLNRQPAEILVTVKPNRPQVRAEQVAAVYGNGRSWEARITCSLHVSGGLVDQVCLLAPPPWNGPYKASVPGLLKTVDVPGEGRQLLFLPTTPIASRLDFTISGPLELARGDRPCVPDAVLQAVDSLQRWVAVPEQSQGQTLLWQTRGLRRCNKENRPTVPVDKEVALYSVAGNSMQAILRSSTVPRSAMVVNLADIYLAWCDTGACHGVAVFDLEPGGATECPLHMPDGQELVQVLIDGAPAAVHTAGNNAWRIPLNSKRLPQRISVVFRGRTTTGVLAGQHTLYAPRLGELPVKLTLWTVAGPALLIPGDPTEGKVVVPWQQNWQRVESVAATLESAAPVSADNLDETPRWYPHWIRRLMAARRALDREMAVTGATAAAQKLQSQWRQIEERQYQLAEQLDALAAYQQAAASTVVAEDAAEIWLRTVDPAAPLARIVCSGNGNALTLNYHLVAEDRLLPRLAAALGLLVLALAAATGWHAGVLPQQFRRWPHVTAAAFGVVWWLWLWPSVLGVLIVLGAALAAVRRLPWLHR